MRSACPSNDTLGALIDHALDGDATHRVQLHLDHCEACRQAMVAAIKPLASGTLTLPSREHTQSSLIGRKVGRYALRALLGTGGMGHVYEALDTELGRSVAVKVLRTELAGSAGVTERLSRESRIMAKVVHPSVITVYELGRQDSLVFIAMELVRGETLATYVARTRPSWREAVALFEQAGHGLAAAHAAGIVHRDFKPENVLVEIAAGRAARLVVTDFGIARAGEDAAEITARSGSSSREARLTTTGSVIGTPAYMAPEQLAGGPVDVRADVFAFSVSLWEAIFGERPFPGRTIDEIRVAMQRAPRATRHAPRRLVAALERGLSLDPAERWQDMGALLDELAAIRAHRRRVGIASAAVGLVGIGVVGALVLGRPATADDRCAHGLAYERAAVSAALASEPAVRDAVTARLDQLANAWRTAQRATCHAGRQAAMTTACLDARRLELTSIAADLVVDGPAHASHLIELASDPARCVQPAPGLVLARVPNDPRLRRSVTAIRHRMFDAEAARDHADFPEALAIGREIAERSKIWPPLHAEVMYLLGTIESLAGSPETALATTRKAAAIAEAAHHDEIAVSSWVQLSLNTTTLGDATRGLEYVTYAEAGLERLGRPPDLEVMVLYVKGIAQIDAGQSKEAEVALRRAAALAEAHAPEYVPQVIQGLGYLYEDQARFEDAVRAYRTALAHLPAKGPAVASSAVIFRQRLAINLAQTGKLDEALAMAQEAVDLATTTPGLDNLDGPLARVQLAQILRDDGQLARALSETRLALSQLAKVAGERNERYGETLGLEGAILADQGQFVEALRAFERACDALGFQPGDGSMQQARCLLDETHALHGLHRDRDALVIVDKILPVFIKAYGEEHPETATVVLQRATLRAALGQRSLAVGDYERAIAVLERATVDSGHLASAYWELAQLLWKTDNARARQLVHLAVAKFETASKYWKAIAGKAIAWQANHSTH